MQLFMWQPNIVGVTHFVMDGLIFLGQHLMLMMMVTRTQTHLHQPWRLNRCNYSSIPANNSSRGRWTWRSPSKLL